MRRVGVPGGDVCDGSFHRGDTEDCRGERRTGREVGTSPPNFTPLVSCKKNARKAEESIHERGSWVIPMAASRTILFPGKASRVWYTEGQWSKPVEVQIHSLHIICGQKELKTAVGKRCDVLSHIQQGLWGNRRTVSQANRT